MKMRAYASRYFGRRQASMDDIRIALWGTVDVSANQDGGEKFQSVLLEQYKLYVEMADRISSRRGLTNTFFITVNAVIVSAASVLVQHQSGGRSVIALVPLAMLLIQCAAWFWMLRSYRQLNSAKYRVIGAMEERLPASPYWRAEWAGLGFGRDSALYLPVSKVEQWTPVTFAIAYITLFFIAIG